MNTDDRQAPDELEELLASLPTRHQAWDPDLGSQPPLPIPPPTAFHAVQSPQDTVPAQITNIDVLANNIENLIQETRKRDVLDGTEFNRQELIYSAAFLQPPEWQQVWSDSADALRPSSRHRVLVIVARRGCGATTFARQLGARHTAAESTLVDLEADWPQPSVARLPLEPHHTYLLELKDTDSDCFDSDFLDRLSMFAEKLRQAGSRLVLTVTAELWAGHHSWSRPGIKVVHLSEPPNAQQLVEHHLRARGQASLIQYVQSTKARESIQGRDAVEAARCVETVIRQGAAHQQRQSTADSTGTPGSVDRPVRLEHLASAATPADGLQVQIELALADWRDDFDTLFNDPGRPPAARDAPLSLSDRCLLLALAIHRIAPASVIGEDAHALERAIEVASGGPQAVGSPSIGAIFAGRGLRPRLLALLADVDSRDQVTFDRPEYSEAVLGYVWDNFPPLRKVLLKWLVCLPDRTLIGNDPAPRALSILILRHRDPQFLDELRELALKADRATLLAIVTERALKDEHMSGATWKSLTRWATQSTQVRAVVAEVCQGVLIDKSSTQSAQRFAMTRLRNLVQTDDPTLRSQVLEVFDSLARRPAMRPVLVREVENWLIREWPAQAGKLALLALMSCEDTGLPWLLGAGSPLREPELRRGLRELFGDVAGSPEIIARAASWLHAAASDRTTAEIVLGRLAPALRGHSQTRAVVDLLQTAREMVLPDGSRVIDQLFEHIAPRVVTGAEHS
ncbi:hypothetical protein ACFW1A_01535 [Kitasatospora sp. NPDC058965]|uniref:hypothetical protein n=1 Tax=Kitasatospora sp. NPDC058965 TaxID=3346682 RepID=UPI003675ED91